MFSVWQSFGREQHRIVGRVPRLLERSQDGQAVYRGGRPKRYDLILTGVSFLDKTMLHWYWENDPRLVEARKYVDEHLNCEDLLMNCKLDLLPNPSYALLVCRLQTYVMLA